MEGAIEKTLNNMKKSTKSIGRFEEPIVDKVSRHFRSLGYRAFSHVRFNVAWSSALSDIDVLLLKEDSITVVEVKSKRDKLLRAGRQIEVISDYVDYAYVATDKLLKSWKMDYVGLLLVREDDVRVIKEAKRMIGKPRIESLFALPKKCLIHLLGKVNEKNRLKWEIIQQLDKQSSEEFLRKCLKEIVLCQSCNYDNCPVFNFISNNFPICELDPPDSFF